MNLLVLLEVADRVSLKHDLEIAHEIQLAMLPNDTFTGRGIEIAERTRPANTVGGDLLVAYSDGITESKNRAGHPFDEDGLEPRYTGTAAPQRQAWPARCSPSSNSTPVTWR